MAVLFCEPDKPSINWRNSEYLYSLIHNSSHPVTPSQMNRDILNRILCGYDRHVESAPHSHSIPVHTQLLLCGKERDAFQASHNLVPTSKN